MRATTTTTRRFGTSSAAFARALGARLARLALILLALAPWLIGLVAGLLVALALWLTVAVLDGYRTGRGA